MDIKRLLTRGGQPFAAEIVDGTENYKVLMEALGNEVILPELVKSGWKLISLPLGLSKNGIALEDLPRMEYSPSIEEEQDMYDLLGREMPIEERKKLLSTDEIKTVSMSAGNYAIQTREEFLKYLDATADTKMAEDFLPINFFVHPSALFTWDEFRDPANLKWRTLLNQRRNLSMGQFYNLRKWALSNGLKPDFTAHDLLTFYFQWGICGLNVQVLSKKTVERFVRSDVAALSADTTNRTPYINDYGLVDRLQREYRKPGTEKYRLTDQATAVRTSESLRDNEVAVVRIRLPIGEMVDEWETTETTITYNPRFLMIGDMKFTSLCAMGKVGMIHPQYWNPSMEAEMNNEMFLRAIAREFIDKRRVKADVSTYRALCESGCSPLSAITYVKDVLGLGKPEPLATDEDPVLTQEAIVAYLKGEQVSPAAQEMIENIMSGAQNIGNVDLGLSSDMQQNEDGLFAILYCANKILGIPTKEIYNTIKNFDGKEPLKFSNGDVVLPVPSKPIDAAYRGFLEDKKEYRQAQARQADNLLWVDLVARELGPEDATRHVGVRCYVARKTNRLIDLLDDLKLEFEKKVEEVVSDPRLQAAYKETADIFAANAFFSGAMRGFYTYPKEMGADVVRLDPAKKTAWKANVRGPLVEDTVALADDAVYPGFDGDWRWYCVNAVIQPYKVTPRYGFTLRETSLAAVWYATENLPIHGELVKRNLVRAGELPWIVLSQSYPVFPNRADGVGLLEYYDASSKYLELADHSRKFAGVPHILELQYPTLRQEEICEELSTSEEDWRFKVGYGKTLQHSVDAVEEKEDYSPIKRFSSMTAEDFFYTGGTITIPSTYGKKPITISNEGIVVDGRVIRPADVETLSQNEYPVTHLCGRRYILSDVGGALWIVEV